MKSWSTDIVVTVRPRIDITVATNRIKIFGTIFKFLATER